MNSIADLSQSQKRQLVTMWNEDFALNQIAEKFYLSISELEAHLWAKPGFPGLIINPYYPTEAKERTDTTRAKIRELLKDGYSMHVIAERLGTTYPYVANTKKAAAKKYLDEPAFRMKRNRRIKDQIIVLLKSGLHPRDVAKQLHTTPSYVYNLQSELRYAQSDA